MSLHLSHKKLACIAVGVAVATTATLRVRTVGAVTTMSGEGVFEFTYGTDAYPCPTSCGGGFTGASFDGEFAGLDVNGHAFTVTFTGTGNTSGAGGSTQACTGLPTGELYGQGGADLNVIGGDLTDNGITTTGATAKLGIIWEQVGTAIEFTTSGSLYDGSGALVSHWLLGGSGVGTFLPIWDPFVVPLSCFDQFPADIHVDGNFTLDA